jgi:pimeloyl-ACP methyl ester carboxylesterase
MYLANETLALDPEGRKLVQKNSEDSDASVMARAMYEDFQTDLRAEVSKIKVKALMLYPCDLALAANCDGVDALYQGAYKAMPEVKVVRIEESRHFIMLDQPNNFDEALRVFLANRQH